MKRTRLAVAATVILATALILAGCKSRSFTTEQSLVDLAKQYNDLLAAKSYDKILPLLTGNQLAAMQNALPVLVVTASKIETEIEDWEAKCDFMNRDKTRGSVTATYTQHQTVQKVGTLTQQFSNVYEFVRIGNDWKIYGVKVMNQTTVK
jgi:hypothetical protein